MGILERIIGPKRYLQVLRWMYTPTDGASVAVFRMGFGAIMMWEVWRYFSHNWIAAYYTGKQLYFTYPLFHWVHPWPTLELMEAHFLFMALCGLLVALGLFYRPAAVGLFLSFSYVFLLEEARYLNHFYFVILVALAMICIPAHRVWSLDAYIKSKWARWPFLRTDTGFMDTWAVWYIRLLFGITYFYGGIAKLTPDWLRGYPLSDWISGSDDVFLIGPYVHERWMGLFLSYSGLLLDLAFVPLLLWRKTRWLGFTFALAFNLMNAELFSIGIFPWMMIVGTLIFFEPDWPRKLWDNLTLDKPSRLAYSQKRWQEIWRRGELSNFTTVQKVMASFLIFFALYQLLFPLRHWLYPGSVHWTEEGHKFSWHMKLRSKNGNATFVIKDREADKTWGLDPRQFLNNRQYGKMITRPDMILFFAHWLRDYYKETENIDVDVYADAWSSLNGRKPQRLIDPSVNLAEVHWSPLPSSWIVPLHTPLR